MAAISSVGDSKKYFKITPIIATLRSSTKIFEVKCEASGKWLTSAYISLSEYTDDDRKKVHEMIKKSEYLLSKIHSGSLRWDSYPVGYWLSDGRLVSRYFTDGLRIEPYFGEIDEIVNKGREIQYTLDGEFAFFPSTL